MCLRELVLDGEEGELAVIDERQRRDPGRRQLSGDRRTDRAAGAGDEHPASGEGRALVVADARPQRTREQMLDLGGRELWQRHDGT
jgi:hypothetical protein